MRRAERWRSLVTAFLLDDNIPVWVKVQIIEQWKVARFLSFCSDFKKKPHFNLSLCDHVCWGHVTRVHLQNVSPSTATVAALAMVVSPSASTRGDRYPWVYFCVLLSSQIFFQNQFETKPRSNWWVTRILNISFAKTFNIYPCHQGGSRQLVTAYCDCLWRPTIPWETVILHIFITLGVTRHPRLVMAAMMLQ